MKVLGKVQKKDEKALKIEETHQMEVFEGKTARIYRDDEDLPYIKRGDGFYKVDLNESEGVGGTRINNQIIDVEAEVDEPTQIVPSSGGGTSNLGLSMADKQTVIREGRETAKILTGIIKDANLYSTISGKQYVKVEGWETLGALMKCKARIEEVEEYKTGYKAKATVYNQFDEEISSAIAICTRDEKNWKDRDDYAIMSMAQTRAVGKAYRLGFSWIIQLAGYEATPQEEM